MDYEKFLDRKTHVGAKHGFEPTFMPEDLYPFQIDLTTWAIRKGRAAIFADCGLGKTLMQLVWAQNVVEHTNKRVLILTPLAVSFQTVKEAEKFGIDIAHRRDEIHSNDRIVVTNYEKLSHFSSNDFVAAVCDESSILKNYDGATRKDITDFMRKLPYRLLCTATAAPNDYIELGTSSEALGELGYADMLSRFFKKAEKTYSRKYEHMSGIYRFRGHAKDNFWRWVCSWSRAVRRPSDLGYDNNGFELPLLNIVSHIVEARTKPDGFLFNLPAVNLQEQRDELRRTINERCELVADLINAHNGPAIAWCHLNTESAKIKQMIPDAIEVNGSDSDKHKEESFIGFADGSIRVLVTKPSIAGFGLNWQHCAHQTFFPSHSYEQYYQAVRRSWRFGQKNEVKVDIVSTEGQRRVFENLQRKSKAADLMFEKLTLFMRNELNIKKHNPYTKQEEVPEWL